MSFALPNDLPVAPLYVAGFIAGATLSSFAGLAVDRLPHQLAWREAPEPNLSVVSPRSRCDACATPIAWPYLIPILGYLFSRGRCAHCGTRVSPVYPLAELVGGAGVCAFLFALGFGMQGLAAAAVFLVLIFLAWIDSREQWLPAVVTLPLFWAGLLWSPFVLNPEWRIAGAATGFVLMWLAMTVAGHLRGIDALAGGDIALAAAAGAWLGIFRLPMFLFLTSVLFIVYALPARRRGRLQVPMGPALALAFTLCLH